MGLPRLVLQVVTADILQLVSASFRHYSTSTTASATESIQLLRNMLVCMSQSATIACHSCRSDYRFMLPIAGAIAKVLPQVLLLKHFGLPTFGLWKQLQGRAIWCISRE